jgi:hypothetical protein
MAGFRGALIDGLALVLVGGGLTAAALSYADGIPDPARVAARGLPAFEDPVATGSITARAETAAEDPAEERAEGSIADPWVDPPHATSEAAARGPV